jgi:hypothetical protein
MTPVTMKRQIKPINISMFEKSMDNGLPVKLLKAGRNNSTIARAKTKAMAEMRIDSPRNCLMSCERLAPMTFRNPTSLERFMERAVARFMKLIHAMNNINAAISVKKITY